VTPTADIHLKDALHQRGQRVTPQRLAIHRTIRDLDRHVSAEELLDAVERTVPGVSLPTVYSTLELLEELGLIRRVGSFNGRALFDPRLDPHHHAVCSRCGRVDDLEAPVETAAALAEASRAGYAEPSAGLIVTGVCGACRRS
jgi:Fur family ferric uptake transcriptional regulator/Fur family peroxide stress response transcriptional regulator